MAGPISIRVTANASAARAELARTSESARLMGGAMSKAGKLIAGAFAVGALVRAGEAVGKVGASYVSSLNKIQALTGASNAQLDKAAKSIEANTAAYAKYGQTAGDAANGIVELTKSGLSLDKALGAVRGTLTLAKAGELDVASASELVANSLNTFSLRAGKAADVANALANAANISSADVRDVAESFKYVSPLAAQAGLTVAKTSGILAELANGGIKASQAGTSLRSVLLRLQAPSTAANVTLDDLGVSVFNAQGKMRRFPALIGDLAKGIDKLKGQDRAYAIKNIFGTIASPAATILLKGGTKALEDYTKRVKTAGTAQRFAEAGSKGLAGTLATLKASAESSAQALYREYSPDLNRALQTATQYVSDHKDELLAAGRAAEGKLAPALKAIAKLAVDTGEAFGKSSGPLTHDLLPALGKLLDLTTSAANTLDKLPGPVKAIGVEAGIAALILPRLTASITGVATSLGMPIVKLQQFRAELTYTATRAQATSEAMAKLSSAARAAAGVGGMVLLAQSANTANDSLKGLEQVAGGALLGFSVGGPIGLAIGGSVAALAQLKRGTDKAADAARTSIRTWEDYASTLDAATGAMTSQTRSAVVDSLYKAKVLQNVGLLGLSQQTVISGVLGETRARGQLAAAVAAQTKRVAALRAAAQQAATGQNASGQYVRERDLAEADALTRQANARQDVIDSIVAETGSLRASLKEKRDVLAADRQVPRRIVQHFQQKGIPDNLKELAHLIERQHVARQKVESVIKMTGIKASLSDIEKITGSLKGVGKVKPTLRTFQSGVQDDVATTVKAAKRGASDIVKGLTQPVKNAKGDLSLFSGGIVSGARRAAGQAHAGGIGVGVNLTAGTAAGIRATGGVVATAAATMISAALSAMRARAKIHSPSRETQYVGEMLGEGLLKGIGSKRAAADKAGKSLMGALLAGVTGGSSGVGKALDKITQLIDHRIKGKDQEKRQAAVLKGLRDEYAALKANGRLQDANQKKLDAAVSKYKSLVQAAKAYGDQIKASIVDSGNVVGLGADDAGTVTLSGLLDQLKNKVADAKRFAQLIKELRKEGLNKTSIQQLLDAGPAAALSTAEALASGGQAAVNQVNTLTAQLTKSGSGLAAAMVKEFKQAGIQAAAGIVEGLKAKQKDLDKAAQRLGQQLAAAVKKALGIKSPSRVFRGIADDTVAGLVQQLKANEMHVRSAGARLAKATVTGYQSTSALDAFNTLTAGGASPALSRLDVQLTPAQMTDLQRGVAVHGQYQVAAAAGKRTVAR